MARNKVRITGSEKLALLKRHLVNGEEVSKVCEEARISPSAFYRWQEQLFSNGGKALELDSTARDSAAEKKVAYLESKLAKKDSVIAHLMQEHIELKKNLGED